MSTLRNHTIRLAASFPKGSAERNTLLHTLKKAGKGDTDLEKAAHAMMDAFFDLDKIIEVGTEFDKQIAHDPEWKALHAPLQKALVELKKILSDLGDDSGTGHGENGTWAGIISDICD